MGSKRERPRHQDMHIHERWARVPRSISTGPQFTLRGSSCSRHWSPSLPCLGRDIRPGAGLQASPAQLCP